MPDPPAMLRLSVDVLLDRGQVLKFGLAGIAGMITDNAVLFLLVSGAGVHPVLAKLGAVSVAIAVSFAFNERYTYDPANRSKRAVFRRYLRSNLVRTGGVTVALGTLYVLHDIFGIWYIFANLIGIGSAFVVNYTSESLFTWRIHRPDT